jgi:hypothetical protein
MRRYTTSRSVRGEYSAKPLKHACKFTKAGEVALRASFSISFVSSKGIPPEELQCPIRSPLDSLVQVLEVALEVSGSARCHWFGPEDIAALTTAFEAALGKLGLVDRSDPTTVTLAKLIIELAKAGEREPERLCDSAVKRLSK